MLNDFAEANQGLNECLTKLLMDNADLVASVSSLSRELAAEYEQLKADLETHFEGRDGLFNELENLCEELLQTKKARDDEESLLRLRIEDLETSLSTLKEQIRQDEAEREVERLEGLADQTAQWYNMAEGETAGENSKKA